LTRQLGNKGAPASEGEKVHHYDAVRTEWSQNHSVKSVPVKLSRLETVGDFAWPQPGAHLRHCTTVPRQATGMMQYAFRSIPYWERKYRFPAIAGARSSLWSVGIEHQFGTSVREICAWLSEVSTLRDKEKRDVGRANAPAEGKSLAISMNFVRSGEWLPADELRAKAMEALHTRADITLDLAEVDHLDTSALQILLAVDKDRRDKGFNLHLVNASQSLRQWFEYAGMPAHLSSELPEQP
jgi:ABC-type transporter Mla MlaB component